MDAHLQQVNMLLLEQKAVLMQQEKQHQHAILQRRKVAKWEGSQRGIGEAHDQQNVLTPRMSFEQHLTDDMLRQLLEKVFRSADEEHAGKNAVIIFSLKSLSITSVRQVVPDEASDFLSGHLPLFQAASSIVRLQHCFLLVHWALQDGNSFNFSPVLKSMQRGGLNMGPFWRFVMFTSPAVSSEHYRARA